MMGPPTRWLRQEYRHSGPVGVLDLSSHEGWGLLSEIDGEGKGRVPSRRAGIYVARVGERGKEREQGEAQGQKEGGEEEA